MDEHQYAALKQYLITYCVGARHAKTSQQICTYLGIDARELRDPTPLRLLEDGVLLCSDSAGGAGYYIPTSYQEYKLGSKHLLSRSMTMLYRLKLSDELATKRFAGQGRLFEAGQGWLIEEA